MIRRCEFEGCREPAPEPNRYCSKGHAKAAGHGDSWIRRVRRVVKKKPERPPPEGAGFKCRRVGCEKEAIKPHVYCSKECSPLGSYGETRIPDVQKSKCKKCGHLLGHCTCEWRA